jgi:hypothetical protein
MDLKALITEERKQQPPRIILHGVQGVGKSTWAAQAPKPIFLPTEDGLVNIKVAAFPVSKTFDEAMDYMDALASQEHSFTTFVLDTADWLEKLIWAKICDDFSVTSIESLGYGKGYVHALTHWQAFLKRLDTLQGMGMPCILLAHTEIAVYNPPDSNPYDRFQIKLHKKAVALLEEWADMVLFANFEAPVIDAKTKKPLKTEQARIIHTTSRPAWRAKTRYTLPETISLDNFNYLLEEVKKNG